MKLLSYLSKIPRQFFKYLTPLFPLRNKAIFDNFGGRGFGDNPKYVALELHRQSPKTKIFWISDKNLAASESLPSFIKPLHPDSTMFYYHLGTAKVWVSNVRDYYYQMRKKRKGQFYLQTWHGFGPSKKIEKDAEQYLSQSYIQLAKKDSKITDIAIANSELNKKIFHDSYWYNGKIFCCEAPRCDILFDLHQQGDIKNKLNIKKEKLCLYAPTFRKDGQLEPYNIDYNALKECLEKNFGGTWKIAIRLHPNLADKTDALKIPKNVLDLTLYPDMQELLAISDLLITDFSSCMHDFSITNRPVFLYAPDYDDYLKNEREMYVDPRTFPFPLAKSNKELKELISKFDQKKYTQELKIFSKKTSIYTGKNGSEKVAKILVDHIYGQKDGSKNKN